MFKPKQFSFLMFFSFFALVIIIKGNSSEKDKNHFPTFVDRHTIALWLFDETPYPNCILTDASIYEHDLRLVSPYSKWWDRTEGEKGMPPGPPLHVAGKYGLVKGKYGNALYTPAGGPAEVVWPSRSQRYGKRAYLSDRGNEVPERLNLGCLDFTIEFWFKSVGPQEKKGIIFGVINDRHPRTAHMMNALFIEQGRRRFLLSSKAYTKVNHHFELSIPTDTKRISDGQWHHLAFTYTSAEEQIRHYVDGVLQSMPKKGGFLPTQNQLRSLKIGQGVNALFDEYRISDNVRYTKNFVPPDSLSRNYGKTRPLPKPNGPPLLFDSKNPHKEPVPLLSRKHVFIDDALIESMENVEFTCNPPTLVETNFRNTKPWECGPVAGSTIPNIFCIWKEDGLFKMLYDNRGLWGARNHAICYAESQDGINWEKPILNLKTWGGNTENNIVLRNACQGTVLVDTNPNVIAEEKYKFIAWNMYWGFYVFVSPDGIHWRRNEVCALPFDPDGGNSTFWDDQCGIYRTYIRAKYGRLDPFIPTKPWTYRTLARLEIPEIMKPWSFQPDDRPNLEFKLAKPVRGELPIIDTGGQIYRFKGHKYSWAPDTYVAFPWRYFREENIRPGAFLMVSRDGETWKRYETPYYFSNGWKLNGLEVVEATTIHGLIRQGDEIWQYGKAGFASHGGPLYGGKQIESSVNDRLLLLKQRLDGFVSLDAGNTIGSVITKPLVFKGEKLIVNVSAHGGKVRISLMTKEGKPFEGWSLDDCDPITIDRVSHRVTWNGKGDLGTLVGKVIRVKFELQNAKIYAMQFLDQNS